MATGLTAGIVRNANLISEGNTRPNGYGGCHMNVYGKVPIVTFDFNVVRWHALTRTSRIGLSRRTVPCGYLIDCSGFSGIHRCPIRRFHAAIVV